jgi:hypothetical protein
MDVVIEKAFCKRIFGTCCGSAPEDRARSGGRHAAVRNASVLQSQVGGAKATLSLDLAEGFPVVTFSKPHLERILWNLVTNASEALSERGGTVSIGARVGGRGAVLSVIDDGPGMEREVLDRVMEPFFTTKEAATARTFDLPRPRLAERRPASHYAAARARGRKLS